LSSTDKNTLQFESLTFQQGLSLLQKGSENAAQTLIWTKTLENRIDCVIRTVDSGKAAILLTPPKKFDHIDFLKKISQSGSRECCFNITLSAGSVFFKSKLLDLDENELKFEIPSVVYRSQRRKNLRLPMTKELFCWVEIPEPYRPENLAKARIVDLSVDGIAISLPLNKSNRFTPGNTLPKFFLFLKTRSLIMEGEIKNTKIIQSSGKNDSDSYVRLGITFTNLRGGKKEVLENFIKEATTQLFLTLTP